MSKWLKEEEQQENTTAFVEARLRGLKMFQDERRTIFFRRIFIFFCRRTRVCIHVDEFLGFSVTIMFDEVLGDTVSVTISSESR